MKWLRSSLFKNNSDTFVFEENIKGTKKKEKFEKMYEISGVYMLDEGLKMSLEPSHLARHERNRKRAEAEGKK